MSKERLKDLIFTAQCAIGEYNDTLDSNLLDKADDLLEYALKELEECVCKIWIKFISC